MKTGNRVLITAAFSLLLMVLAGFLVLPGGSHLLEAAEKELEHSRLPSERSHPWDPGPGKVVLDYHPPPVLYYYPFPGVHSPPPGYPIWSPQHHYPDLRYHHPYSPPFYGYPPGYEPEIPWYEDEPPVPAGRVLMLVEPMQAEVTVNGYSLQRHPDLSYQVSLLQGEHRLEVTAEGYLPFQRSVLIQGGEQLRLTIRLQQIVER
jgi:hypothetical protein